MTYDVTEKHPDAVDCVPIPTDAKYVWLVRTPERYILIDKKETK